MPRLTLHDQQKRFQLKKKLLQTQSDLALSLLTSKWPKDIEHVEVYFVSSKMISQLHADFLNDPTPTDVITFQHGEIFICPDVADRQRHAENLNLHDEVMTYIIHGLLHLCGWDDHSERAFLAMRKKQTEIMQIVQSKLLATSKRAR